MDISSEMIKELRDRTGVGIGKCKEALAEAKGDLEKAIEILRKAGMTSAVKKEGRATKEGSIGFAESETLVALVEVNAETDFVVQNSRFGLFLHELCHQALQTKPASLEDFLAQKYVKDPSVTVDQARNLMVQSFGENVVIRRVEIIQKKPNHSIGIYSHMAGKILSLVELVGSAKEQELAKSIAMHVAAEDPEYLAPSEVPEKIREREEDIARSQIQGKPQNVMDKIVQGKIQAYYDQVCLVCQKFIKDPSLSVSQYVEKEAKRIGAPLSIHRFIRWKVGSA